MHDAAARIAFGRKPADQGNSVGLYIHLLTGQRLNHDTYKGLKGNDLLEGMERQTRMRPAVSPLKHALLDICLCEGGIKWSNSAQREGPSEAPRGPPLQPAPRQQSPGCVLPQTNGHQHISTSIPMYAGVNN